MLSSPCQIQSTATRYAARLTLHNQLDIHNSINDPFVQQKVSENPVSVQIPSNDYR